MMKKFGRLIVLAFSIAVLLVGFYFFWRNGLEQTEPLKAIPPDAAIIIKIREPGKNIRLIREGNEMWAEFLAFLSFNQLNNQLLKLDSIIREDHQVSDMFERYKLTLSFHQSGQNKYDYIAFMSVLSHYEEKHLIRMVEHNIEGKAAITGRKYSGVKVHDVRSPENRALNFSFTFSRGLFMISHSGILLEEAIRQLDQQGSIDMQSGFIRVAGTAGQDAEANIYINYKSFPAMFALLLEDKYRKSSMDFTDFARWTELDISVRDDAVLLNGFTASSESGNGFMNVFLDQKPQKIEIEKIIPDQVAALIVFGIEDFRTYNQRYKEYLKIKGSLKEYQDEIQAVNEKFRINIEDLFYSFMEKEAGIVITDIKNYDWDQNTFLVLRTASRSMAEDNINEILKNAAENERVNISTMVQYYKIDDDTQLKIYRMPVPQLAKKLFGIAFEGINNHYCTFIDNYLIFGNSIPALSEYIHANLLQNNLSSDLEFNKFSEYLSSKSNIYVYINAPRSAELLQRYLNENIAGEVDEHKEQIRKFQALALQVTTEGNLFYNNIFLKYSPEVKDPQTVWASRLDNPADFKPVIVINHNTREKEIFMQDMRNVIYLISSSGRILWKLRIEGRIMNDVYQIDFYGNGKLQYLFNTKNQIHLIDRNGNYVEKYPVTLRSPASNAMTLVDYEGDKNYRIFVATEDRMIYAYNKEGQTIKGWAPEKTEYILSRPLHHFRIGDNDYLICADRYNTYILNRKGESRVKVKDHFQVSRNNDFIPDFDSPGTKPGIVITDTIGHIHFIYFDGSSEEVICGEFSPDHYFEYADLDGDEGKEFIFADRNELKVYSHNNKLKFTRSFKSDISHSPAIFQFSARSLKIGIVCGQAGEIYLVNSDGSIYKGFPLEGSTRFSISNFSRSATKFNLLVGSKHSFLYNYSVQ